MRVGYLCYRFVFITVVCADKEQASIMRCGVCTTVYLCLAPRPWHISHPHPSAVSTSFCFHMQNPVTETIQSRPNDRAYERFSPPPGYPSASFARVHSGWEMWAWVWAVWGSLPSSLSSCVSLTLDVRARAATWEANVAACSSTQAMICSRVRRRSADVSANLLLFQQLRFQRGVLDDVEGFRHCY